MIRQFILNCVLLISVLHIRAQRPNIDSLLHEISIAKDDTSQLVLLSIITEAYNEIKPDSTLYFAEKLLILSQKLDFKLNEAYALDQKAYALLNMGNYPASLQTFLSGLAIAEDPKSEKNILPPKFIIPNKFLNQPVTANTLRLVILARINHYIGILYGTTNNFKRELDYYLKAKQITEQIGNSPGLCTIYSTMGRAYLSLKNTDSAMICEQKSYDLAMKTGYKKYLGSILLNLGRIQSALGNKQLAIEYFKKAIIASFEHGYLRGAVASNLYLADLYKDSEKRDSVFHFINAALDVSKYQNIPNLLLRSYTALAGFYTSIKNNDSVVKYQRLIIQMNDSIFNSKQAQLFQSIDFDEEKRRQEQIIQQKHFVNQIKTWSLVAALGIFSLIAFILYRNNRHKQKANSLLTQQKEKVESTLKELKNTQAQLIHSEKMASLGELTAGIAHEIQNPLNFVNNFSDLNKELLEELKIETDKGNLEEVKTIANNVISNEEKINLHGKRADAIVKNMLQHSRKSTGQKEPTDINALADEYIRLAYHGMRAKDKSFNVTIETDFDKTIGTINIIPQDIGRVILNLVNNAFYAAPLPPEGGFKDPDYRHSPTVWVSTKREGNNVLISVRDNGPGIPKEILDKIFQPFFTTKPTGQGTGLGLSLSYDIIKAHGGEIKVETKEGEGSIFIIYLPG